MKIKKWNGSAWVQEYPEVNVSSIVATGTPSSTTFLRGDGTWATPSDVDTNTFVNAASFSTANGELTLTRNDAGTVVVDLDGRFLNQAGGTMTGSLTLSGSSNLSVGANSTAGENHIHIGTGRTNNGFAYIDFVGDTTYTDYGLRIIRGNSGANTTSEIVHRGTGDFKISSNDASKINLRTSNADRLTIDASGLVGIGTSSPATQLEVRGNFIGVSSNLRLANTSATTNGRGVELELYGNSNSFGKIQGFWDGTDQQVRMFSTGSTRFLTNNLTRMTINADGNVGIGTTSPTYKLDVTGNIRSTGEITANKFYLGNDSDGTNEAPNWAFSEYNNKACVSSEYIGDTYYPIYHEGNMPTVDDVTGAQSLQTRYYYDTYGTDSLITNGANGTTSWTKTTGTTTPSGSTGPQNPYTNISGFYYTEASGVNNTLHTMILSVPTISNAAFMSFGFWWHMYGANMGTLTVSYTTNGSTYIDVWSKTGDQGNVEWQQAEVAIPRTALGIRINGTTGAGFASDMCIANMHIDMRV